ncbi:MAG: kynureninase [Gammaproteobacteria bacterium]|nr:kynureninase [Gammaproteobacteria bacterium]
MSYAAGIDFAIGQDRHDPCARFRDEFYFPEKPASAERVLYLCGNSLGLQPKRAAELVKEELEDWQRLAVEGHWKARRPWMPYHENLSADLAGLVGARAGEVVAMNSLTVNLHLMMVSFFRPQQGRHKILIEKPAFPSDRYAVVSQLRFHGLNAADALIEVAPRENETVIRDEDVISLIAEHGNEIALVMLPGVQYYSGQLFDIAAITDEAHRMGCIAGFDLAHAAGNTLLSLHDWDVDFAVWCSYKYLNAGPGAVAGCFLHERHGRDPSLQRFAGWWGHEKATRFEMGPEFHPIPGVEGWQLSNPPILALAPLVASLDIFRRARMAQLVTKSRRLSGYLEFLVNTQLHEVFEIITPKEASRRGCQISLRLRDGAERGRALFKRLPDLGVFVDWREPDVIRAAPVPLYNSFEDVFHFVQLLKRLADS